DDSVLERNEEVRFGTNRSVKPGLHRIHGARVVWWDPSVLGLGRVPKGGLRGTTIFEEGGQEQVEAYLAWSASLASTRELGATPSFRVSSVTKIAHELEASPTSSALPSHTPRIEEVSPLDPQRPSGKRFGTLEVGLDLLLA